MWYFSVLRSKKEPNWFYKGSTKDLRKRIQQHNKGQVQSSKHYIPLKLVYYEAYATEQGAVEREKSVKKSGSVWTPLIKRIKKSLE